MPHFGLMSTRESFDRADGARLRARLHIRSGRQRLHQGKISAGIVTLYDALIFALRWYCMVPEHQKELPGGVPPDITDERAMFAMLQGAGIIDDSFDLIFFETLVDEAVVAEMTGYDYHPMLERFEALMERLEVMPFDETLLPPEEPGTF